MKQGQFSYTVRAALASVVLFYAIRLSAFGRTWIDYVVLTLIVLAILWNLAQLARRFLQNGRPADVWHVLRTVLFWVIGVTSTMLRPESLQSTKGLIGALMLGLAALETVWIHRKERELLDGQSAPLEQAS